MMSTSAAACISCKAGFYCLSGFSEPRLCPVGFYCIANTGDYTLNQCEEGQYSGNRMGLKSPDECKLCPKGHFCLTNTNSIEAQACGLGQY